MTIVLVIFSVIAAIFGLGGFALGVYALIRVEAFDRSTHQVTFFNPDKQNFEELTTDQKTKMSASFDPAKDLI